MSDRQVHRASLLLALFGAILMLAVAAGQFAGEPTLPSSEYSRPSRPEWIRPGWEPRA